MKKVVLLGTICFGFLNSPALSADIPARVYKAPVAAPAPVSTWTGFYIGGEVGGAWANSDVVVTTPPGGNFFTGDRLSSGDPSGWLGGVAGGADYQTGPWVFGIKGSYNWADINGDTITASTVVPTRDVLTHERFKWVGMVLGRVGYAVWPDFLLYVNGGWAWSGRESTSQTVIRATGAVVATSAGSETLGGWTVGVGGEYRVWRYASVLLQYNYVDFGTHAVTSNILTGPTAGTVVGRDLSTNMHLLRFGVNLRFP